MTIQIDNNGQPLVAALQFPVYRLSEFDWKNWTPASRFYYTQFIGIDDTATPVVYSLRYCVPGVAGGVGQVSSNTLEDFQAEIADVLARQDKIDLDVADLLAQVNSLLTTAQDVATQAQSSVTSAAQSATTATGASATSKTWAEGEDTAVAELGGTHSSKVWAAQSESHAADANNAATQSESHAAASESSATSSAQSATASAQSATASAQSATLAQDWATKTDGMVDGTEYSAKHYANQASGSATASAQSATNSATSAQSAQDAVATVNGLIAFPIGTIMQAIYIDESLNIARRLNGQVIIQSQFVAFTNKVKAAIALYPSLATTEANWQAEKTNSRLGQCGKFVIDDTAGTIRLPAVVNAQGLVDLALIGGIKSESLPNITGYINNTSPAGQDYFEGGALYWQNKNYNYPSALHNATDKNYAATIRFDASRSSSTYQNNAPVQQEAVQYPYYIQVATGVEETLPAIREYNINTPFFFGMHIWSDTAISNASWLISNGSYHSGATYVDFYEWLLKIKNGTLTVDGVSVKAYGASGITDYDYVINTADTTFRLPIKVKLASGNAVVGNGTSLGITDGTNFAGFRLNDAYNVRTSLLSYGKNVGTTDTGGESLSYDKAVGITTDPTKSGIETSSSGLKLYFYVGDTVQDASLINAGAVLGQLSNKADIDASNFNADGKSLLSGLSMPSNRYIDLTLGASGSTYTAPANGYFYAVGNWANNGSLFYLTFDVTGKSFGTMTQTGISGPTFGKVTCPVSRGDVVTLSYNLITITDFRFIYAEGEN